MKTLRSIALTGALLLLACTARAQWVDSTTAWFDYTGGTVVPSGYLTIKDETTSLAQEGILTFLGSSVTCVDSPSHLATECTFTGGGGGSVATDTIWDAAGDLVYGTGADTAAKLAKGTATQLLHSGTTPSWSAVDLAADVTGVLPFANITNGSALSLFGRSANSSGVQASVTASAASDCVFRESGSALGCGTVATAGIANSAVTLAKIANAAASTRVLGSGSSGSGAAYTELPLGGNIGIGANILGTQTLGFDPTRQWMIYDEFNSNAAAATDAGGNLKWIMTNTSSPTTVTKIAGETNHPGITESKLGTTGTSAQTFYLATNDRVITGGETFEWYIRIPNLSDGTNTYTLRCGLSDATTGGDATDGAYFQYTNGTNSGKWQIKNRSNSSGAAVNTNSTVAAATWYRLTIVIDSGATQSSFYINGTEVTNSPIVGGLPTGAGRATTPMCGWLQSATDSASTSAVLDIDYFWAFGPITR